MDHDPRLGKNRRSANRFFSGSSRGDRGTTVTTVLGDTLVGWNGFRSSLSRPLPPA
jgi:hypothetical protein